MNFQDLRSWAEDDFYDSNSVKGLTAELAACIGPDMVEQTMISLGF